MEQELAKLYARAPGVALAVGEEADRGEELPPRRNSTLARLCELFPDSEEAAQPPSSSRRSRRRPARPGARRSTRSPGGSSKTAKEAAAPAKKQYDKAHATRRKALAETKNSTQATRQLEAAVEEFQAAQKLLDSAMKKEGADSDLAAHYDAWTAKVKEDIVATYVDIANLYFSRQSHSNALKAVNDRASARLGQLRGARDARPHPGRDVPVKPLVLGAAGRPSRPAMRN